MGVVARLHELIEFALRPIDALPGWAGMLVVSIVTGIVVLWCVGKLTPQRRLARVRDKAIACIYEMRLFVDRPRIVARAQASLLRWSAWYVALTLPALVVLALPLFVAYQHLDARWGRAPLRPDEPALVHLSGFEAAAGEISATCDAGCDVTAPVFVDPDSGDAFVRVEARHVGTATLHLAVDTWSGHMPLATDLDAPIAHGRYRGVDALWLTDVVSPLESDAPIDAVTLPAMLSRGQWFGSGWPWWTAWLGLSTLVAFVMRRPMGIVL